MKPDYEKKISDIGIDQDTQNIQMRDLGQENETNSEVPGRINAPRFNPRTAFIELTKYGVTGAISFVSSSSLEAVALVGASLAAGLNPLAGQDPKIAVAALVLSYIPLITGTLQNADQAWKSLNETGASVSFLAKIGYDLSRNVTKNERIQKVATFTGFSVIELAKEIPWYIGAYAGKEGLLIGATEYYTSNMEFSFLAGANIFGAAYQYVQAGAVEGILRGIRNREKIMNIFRRDPKKTSKLD